jgi:hypothetical protein
MALFLCRWENGDFSVVQASNRELAIEMLDEVANAEGMPVYQISNFMAHFQLTDEGVVEFECFGEQFEKHVRKCVHPVLGKLSVSPYDAAPEERAQIKEAIELERSRVSASPAPEPDTELGKQIKAQTDFPTSVINRHVHTEARKLLRKSKPKGKPS